MTCVRYETGGTNARYVFIQDKNSSRFSVFTPFYANQLEKRLTANVLKEGQWGSYRHLQLEHRNGQERLPSVQVEHAYITTLIRGDMSSLRWIESPLKYYQLDNFSRAIFCNVYYASINSR